MSDENPPADAPPRAAGAGTSDEEPGAPQDEVDEELLRLSPPSPPRSPLLALAVLVVGAILLVHLRADLRYALAPRTPVDLGDARALAVERLVDDTYAVVSGQPDYRDALLFEPRGDSYRRAFFRLLGTGTRLVVRAAASSTGRPLDERFTGRLRRFDAIPWAAQVRDYYAHLSITRFVDAAALRRLLGAGALPASAAIDDGGGPLALDAARPMWLAVDFPDQLVVSLAREQFAVEEDARHELERLGAPIVGTAAPDPLPAASAPTFPVPPTTFDFYVRVAPAARDAYIARLDEKGFRFAARRAHLPVSPADLRGGAAGVTVKGVEYPWSAVRSLLVSSPVTIPADAFILVEGEGPRDLLWVPLVAGVLVLFLAFNAWLLARRLREARARAQDAAR